MKKTRGNYYLGFDIGTNSVGWAVTNEDYQILRFNGKNMWGSRLFDEAQTAEKRRLARTTRRRLARRHQRLELLQDLFSEEIYKVDPGFFQRMKESALWQEDKTILQKNALFNDSSYTDADFHRDYPTIYHLRRDLITKDEKKDIRLVYLALHHIIKHRGHFLFVGEVANVTSFPPAFEKMKKCLEDEFDLFISCDSLDRLADIIKDKHQTKRDKVSKVSEIVRIVADNEQSDITKNKQKQLKAVVGLICGLKCKLADLFADESLKEAERPNLSFSEGSFDEVRLELEDILQERYGVIDIIKGVYDWGILADILKGGEYEGNSYLSVAKVKLYEKHQRDLSELKKLFKYLGKDEYNDFFRNTENEHNYCSYVGSSLKNRKRISIPEKRRTTYDDFKKEIEKKLDKITDPAILSEEKRNRILSELDAGTFLPLQVSKDNGVIPHQVHEFELKKILQNQEKYYEFLGYTDETGKTISEKIIQIFEFRIPYYVGPLNTYAGKDSWMERKPGTEGPIRPWNFSEKVDENKSAEKFIRRMTNKCSYYVGKDVIPKNSLLYSEFMVWNEINNLRIQGNKLPIELKRELFNQLFMEKKRVTLTMILQLLKCEGFPAEKEELSGIDQTIKSSLSSYLDMKKIFGESICLHSTQAMVEDLILWITLYSDDPKMLCQVIRQHYQGDSINETQLKKLCNLRYQGWGRLSREFLTELQGVSKETGEEFNIIDALRNTNDNLMQLMSDKYTFKDELVRINRENTAYITTLSYDNLMQDIIASPAIKRAAWQTIRIADEIRKIMGKDPQKIFIEMARGPMEKKRTDSRKQQLIQLYSKIKDESTDWKAELENHQESDFRSIKLYLYYTQMGKCMYSGESIDLSRLADATIYDRDHIYPQSKTKDDSLDNLVLVKRDLNAKKSADLISPDIQKKMDPTWRYLMEKGLISKEKYNRLVRKTPLTDEELSGFINRQLVETRQSTKVVADLFERIYQNVEIVYVKAKAVADFRHENLQMIKCRSLNDYHHARDAYLNIVVGNVYNEKFTNNPLRWLKENRNREYSLSQVFYHDLEKNGRTIWKRGKEGTIKTVQKQLAKRDIRYTRYATENKCGQNGGLFDSKIVSKNSNASVPIKKGMDVKKYGGYKRITPAYFALIESEGTKGERLKTIEAVPLYKKDEIEKNPSVLLQYCEKLYGLRNPKILIPKIKKDALLVINGFPMHLRGTTGTQLSLQGAVQLILDPEYETYYKKIEKFLTRKDSYKGKEGLKITKEEGIQSEKNLWFYDELLRKQKDTIYQYRPAGQLDTLEKGRDIFIGLPCEEQCEVLNEILNLLRCKPVTANLKKISGSGKAGSTKVGNVISKCTEARLIYQSITGLFEQEIDLLEL